MAQSHRESRDFPLAEAQRLKAERLSNYAIAQALGWSEPTVRRKLQGRRIKGELGAPDDPPATNAPTNGDISTDTALVSADTVQSWDDPEDGKPERWNLWIPRGLKRQIEALAKTAGIAPSQLVQRLLMAALPGKEVRDA